MLEWTYRGHPVTRPVQLIGGPARGAGQDRRLRRVPLRRRRGQDPPLVRRPRERIRLEHPGRVQRDRGRRPADALKDALNEKVEQQSADHGHDHRLRDRPRPHRGQGLSASPRPAPRSASVFPQAGRKPAQGTFDTPGRHRLLQVRDERVRLEPRLHADRADSSGCGSWTTPRGGGKGAINQIQIKARPGVDLDHLAAPDRAGPGRPPARRLFHGQRPGSRSKARSWRRWRSSRASSTSSCS